jgi:hypothetical protein
MRFELSAEAVASFQEKCIFLWRLNNTLNGRGYLMFLQINFTEPPF